MKRSAEKPRWPLILGLAAPGAAAVAAGAMLAVTAAAPASATFQVADSIVAVVEDELVMSSEVEDQLQLFLLEAGVEPGPEEVATLRAQVLKQLVDVLLIVNEAERRELEIDDARLDFYVEQQLQQQVERLGGTEEFRRQLEAEGVSEKQMREFYRDDVRGQLLASELARMELEQDIVVTEEDARAYFETHAGEFPKRPDQLRLRHLLIQPKPSADREVAARDALAEAHRRILAGEDFADVAREVSLDPTASRGGEIGFFRQGDLDPSFTQAAFALADSAISDVVRSAYGYHVIQRLETRGDEIRARHIVRPHRVTPDDIERAESLVGSVRRRLEEGADFVELVRAYSDAPDKDGDVGYVPIDALPAGVRDAVVGLEIGGVSAVVADEQGYHVFQLIDRQAASTYTFEEVAEEMRGLVERERLAEQYDAWIEELRARSYVDIRS